MKTSPDERHTQTERPHENLYVSTFTEVISMRPAIASNGVLYLQMRSLKPLSTTARENGGKMDRTEYLFNTNDYRKLICELFSLCEF